jgi:hypothetical protein
MSLHVQRKTSVDSAEHGAWTSARIAAYAFGIYVTLALPIILFVLADHHWFVGDEWSFLAERDGGSLADLFRSHAEHWSTIPVVSYRILFNLFGLRSYMPYQFVVVVAHLTTAVLLRVVMRRARVGPWTSTIVASVFVLFGPGEENIVWAFQIGFVGAIVFGLLDLICSDHDGPIGRNDWLGLLAGAASLMCSGVSLVMIAAVGLAALIRRGAKAASFHVAPLAAMYAIWALVTHPQGIDNPYGHGASVRQESRFVWSGLRGGVEQLAGSRVSAIALVAFVVYGVALIARRDGLHARRHLAAPFSLALSAVLFLVATGYTRWFVTPVADSQSRYVYTVVALILPAIAVCIGAVNRRWPIATPAILGVFLFATVVNIGKFGTHPFFEERFQQSQRRFVTALAHSPEAQSVPGHMRPSPWFTIGWLRNSAGSGDVPKPGPIPPALLAQVHNSLSVGQLKGTDVERHCQNTRGSVILRPRRGDRYEFRLKNAPAVGASYFVQNAVVVKMVSGDRDAGSLVFKSEFGHGLEVEFPDLTLRLMPADPTQVLVLCGPDR